MRKRIQKMLMPIVLSVICGAICGKLVYGIYNKKMDQDLNGEKVYLIQAGAYSTYDNMVSNTSLNNYIYYEDNDGLYKSIIGLTGNYDNIEKIKSTYSKEVIVNEYYSNDKELNKKIKEYDKRIQNSSNPEETNRIVLEMLTLYKDTDTILTQIIS